MRYISMFSGIEAASVAWHPLGWQPICFAEIERFPSAVLAHRFPNVPNVGDMTAHDWSQYRGRCDVVVGGFPCQSFSIAGLRKSLADDRGNLSLQFAKAIDAIRPVWAVLENVPGWLSTDDNAFGCMLAALVGADDALRSPLERGRWPDAGMVAGPRARAAWRVLDAQHFGVPQRRERVFVVVGFGDRTDPAAVLFESQGVHRDPAARDEARQGSAVSPPLGAGSGGRKPGLDVDGSDGLICPPIANPLTARMHKGVNTTMDEGQTMIAFDCVAGGKTRLSIGDVPGALRGGGHVAGHAAIAFDPTQIKHPENRSKPYPGNPAPTLAKTAHPPAVATMMSVRRLTPTEAERLQGFADGWTDVPYRGGRAKDGPRYRALGNSMAVPCMSWLGHRIDMVDGLLAEPAAKQAAE